MYSLKGPFGGYGNYVRPEPDHQTIDFVAAVDGKPASQIKIIAFLPGCEIVTLDFALEGTAMWRQLECKPLKSITLRGQILPASFAQGKRAKVEVNYHAYGRMRSLESRMDLFQRLCSPASSLEKMAHSVSKYRIFNRRPTSVKAPMPFCFARPRQGISSHFLSQTTRRRSQST